jgi:hypothetical protein
VTFACHVPAVCSPSLIPQAKEPPEVVVLILVELMSSAISVGDADVVFV